jgi:hypothetical protein
MTERDRTNTGTLGKNERKKKEDHPGYTGSLNVEGVEYWVSAWVKQSMDGRKFFSLAVRPKETKEEQRVPSNNHPNEDSFNDIPF